MNNSVQLPTDNSYYISNTLVAEPQTADKKVRVYNVSSKGKIVKKPYVEINGVPRKPYKGFESKVISMVQKTGFCKSREVLKNSFFTPVDTKGNTGKFDSAILLRLTMNYFLLCFLNCKERKVAVAYLEDLYYDNKFLESFCLVNEKVFASFAEFKESIQEMTDWRIKHIKFCERVWGKCR
ncbi:MAG: hypothetical protein J6W41_01735 [Alphaproteobacteria bacterium]|nr:hypothetical protein [Alphaproteobacteria bacterium]